MDKNKPGNKKRTGRIWSFEVPPAPIPASAIKETVNTDVVVLGAGVAGLPAAVSAADWNVIPGLYAAGNTAGGFYGDTYPIHVTGGTCRSHALTFGRLTGLKAARA